MPDVLRCAVSYLVPLRQVLGISFFLCYVQVILIGTTLGALEATPRLARILLLEVAQNSNISVRSLGSNADFSARHHGITRGVAR